jgi:hypothetical protein
LAALVYGVSPYDTATFAATAVAIVGGGVLMTYAGALNGPARRFEARVSGSCVVRVTARRDCRALENRPSICSHSLVS